MLELFLKTIPDWNSLPKARITADTVTAFQSRLRCPPSSNPHPHPTPPPPLPLVLRYDIPPIGVILLRGLPITEPDPDPGYTAVNFLVSDSCCEESDHVSGPCDYCDGHSNELLGSTGVSGRSNSRSAAISSSFIINESEHHHPVNVSREVVNFRSFKKSASSEGVSSISSYYDWWSMKIKMFNHEMLTFSGFIEMHNDRSYSHLAKH